MKHFTKSLLLGLAIGFMCLTALPASAQIEYLTPAQQKKELKRSLKEAKKVKSDYRESHLNVSLFNFKRGESGRKRVKNPQEHDEMLMDPDGTPVTKAKVKPKKKVKSAKKKK